MFFLVEVSVKIKSIVIISKILVVNLIKVTL